jgi:SAM-dependent methyltransferase
MLKRSARAAVRLGLGRPRVRRLVESELGRTRPSVPAAATGPTGAFVDSHGVSHPLDPALRDRLKPGWRTMTDPAAAARAPSDESVKLRTLNAATAVAEASALLGAVAGFGLAGRILEVGCYDGAFAYQASKQAGTGVVASDLAGYYVTQAPGQPAGDALDAQLVRLSTLRERTRVAAGVAAGSVEFVEDDIADSSLEPSGFDTIVSFEVLEHVLQPAAAFDSMARLLRPGGTAYHVYNPFFSVIGGHSLCTLDFPWGHARLDAADVERYVTTLRPGEADQALRFYRDALNRMTMSDLRIALASSGLEVLAIVPWSDRTIVPRLSPTTIAEVRRAYPDVTVDDLLATFVTVVARRPVQGPGR